MIKLVFILCCIFCADFSVRYVYAQEGSACYTPRRDIGVCINFKECDPLLQLLLDNKQNLGVHDYLRASTCGYIGNDPLVCCEKPTITNENNKPDVMIFSNGNQNIPKLPSKPQCGLSNVTNPRIVGGVPAKLNEFPFMAILGYRNKVNPNIPKWLCGGTLITERHILTAAHCAYNRNDLYLARVGELILFDDNDGASPDDIPITNIKMHENFSTAQFTDDIAILTLSRKTTNPLVWPICLPTDDTMKTNTFLGYTGVVTGWGSLYFDGPRSSSLQVADMPILNESNCKKAFGQTTVIDDRVICAGWISGARDTCQGDSGGPIMIGIKEGKQITYYQIGVISYGFRCAEQGYPGVFTRVTKYLDWIQKNV